MVILKIKQHFLYLLPPVFLIVVALLKYTFDRPVNMSKERNLFDITIDFGENSNATLQSDSLNLLTINYKIGADQENPYAGGGFYTKNNFLDLSNYDVIQIDLDSYTSSDFRIIITDYIDGFSRTEDNTTHKYHIYDLSVEKGVSRYVIPLHEFSTPGWWYKLVGIKREQIPRNQGNRGNVSGILFYNHPICDPDTEKTISIKEISFQKNNSALFFGSVFFTLLYVGIYILGRKFFFEKKSMFQYKPINLKNHPENSDTQTLLNFIAEHYSNPDLDMNSISIKTNLSESTVRKILQDNGIKNLRTYINHIRITESKRLLKETNRQIKEIAFSVGYRHISSFNRVFSTFENMSPAEFRETVGK